MDQQPSHAAIKTSNHELDGAGHCAPSKCPDQGWWHQAGIQHFSEAQLTYPAAKAAALWKHRLQITHASERAAGAQASSTPTAINQAERRKENIRVQQSLLVGHQLKPEQRSKRSGSQGQSEPLIFEGADHVASAAAPINRAFSKKPPSTGVLPLSRRSTRAMRTPQTTDQAWATSA